VFQESSGTLNQTVSQATPSITWANPAAIAYGTALSASRLGATASWTVDGKTVNVLGTFTYSPPAGSLLDVGSNQTLSVSFEPLNTADYTTATAQTTITVYDQMRGRTTGRYPRPDGLCDNPLNATPLSARASAL